jgi:hypothetical protein
MLGIVYIPVITALGRLKQEDCQFESQLELSQKMPKQLFLPGVTHCPEYFTCMFSFNYNREQLI